MKIKDFVKVTLNKTNNQINLSLRKRILTKEGLTFEQFLNWPQPRVKRVLSDIKESKK